MSRVKQPMKTWDGPHPYYATLPETSRRLLDQRRERQLLKLMARHRANVRKLLEAA
jgi:hypothetical protein